MLRVLLVEDNAGDAELVRIRLRDAPSEAHEVHVASTLEEGLALLPQTSPDVTLLDLNLPDSEGLETLRAMRTANERAPIVVLTGTDDLDIGVAALRDGADDYIAKLELTREGTLRRAVRYGVERRRVLNDLHFAVRAREELLEVVSHDLRNQIGTIELGARLLQMNPSPENIPRRLGAIERAAGTSMRLLDDLVDLAALEKGGLVVNTTELDLAPLLRDGLGSFSAQAEQRSIQLELAPVEGRMLACADAIRVTQILGNLLANALKFTPPGGAVTLGAQRTDDAFILHVRDTGIGILAKDRPRVFERFFRGSRPSGKGAGLGLAISRALVEAQRGRIWVESEEGKGTTFFFTLPRTAALAISETAAVCA